jgi:hypothetical protein
VKVFEEKISGKLRTEDRPGLKAALTYLRDGEHAHRPRSLRKRPFSRQAKGPRGNCCLEAPLAGLLLGVARRVGVVSRRDRSRRSGPR